MKHLVIAGVALALVAGATSAFAYDTRINPNPPGISVADTGDLLACDDGTQVSAFFANMGIGYGNGEFDLGGGAQISRVQFEHYGWLTLAGPYDYDLVVYDDATCTPIAACRGRQAADAFDTSQIEEEDTCDCNLFASGLVAVVQEPYSCASPTDCYPDVWTDGQAGPSCQRIIDPAGPLCTTNSTTAGAHLLRVELDKCTTPVEPANWGGVKALYK